MSKNIYSFSFVIFFFNIKNVSSAIVLFYISEPLYVVWPFYKYLCKALTIHTQIQILYFTVTARYLQIHCNSCTTLQHVTFISRDYWTVKSCIWSHQRPCRFYRYCSVTRRHQSPSFKIILGTGKHGIDL